MVSKETVSKQTIVSELSTLRDFIRYAAGEMHRSGVYLGHGTDNLWDEAVQLVTYCAGLPWDINKEVLSANLLTEEKQQVLALLEKRVKDRVPLPYLTGEAWFCGLPFTVDERVLIPRSPIAQLIQQDFQPWVDDVQVGRVLDLCTGSGCIGIACAYAFGLAEVDLVDLSADALEVCRTNIKRHELENRVTAIESDLFTELQGKKYQLIVSNPPYVDMSDLASMPAEYGHEPAMALGSGDDGLDITRKILAEAPQYLTEDGLLVVEVGNSEAALQEAFPDVPFIWIELPEGGNGVFILSAGQLNEYHHLFA